MPPAWIFYSLLAGLVTAWLMHALMLILSHRREVPVDMVSALGSYFTRETGRPAHRAGLLLHSAGGAVLGLVYASLFHWAGIQDRPVTILAGGVLGFFHGLVVSYALMYWVAERHPVERYRKATPFIGLVHLVGHIAFGVVLAALVVLAHLVAGPDASG